jgi:hypothetical protein
MSVMIGPDSRLFRAATPGHLQPYANQHHPGDSRGHTNAPENPLDNQTGIVMSRPHGAGLLGCCFFVQQLQQKLGLSREP